MTEEVVIIDYGMGNLHSVKSAFEFLNCKVVVTADALTIEKANFLVLPGVGSFRKAMLSICEKKFDHAIKGALGNKAKFLGICLGFQLCGTESSEDGKTSGLGLIEGHVDKFQFESGMKLKIPHVGFNEVNFEPESQLFKGIENLSDFYFNHSYRFISMTGVNKYSLSSHGEDFISSFEGENVFGTQFHPEKSQTNGLKLLSNFLRI